MYRRSGLVISREQGAALQCLFCSDIVDVRMWHAQGVLQVAVLVVQ